MLVDVPRAFSFGRVGFLGPPAPVSPATNKTENKQPILSRHSPGHSEVPFSYHTLNEQLV